MSNDDRHSCCICDRQIPLGLLMCAPHWRRVPAAEQAAVMRAYGRWTRHIGSAAERLPLARAYQVARDAAVASVERALDLDLSGEQR